MPTRPSDRYSLAAALLVLSMYILNLAYKKAIQDTGFLSQVKEFSGAGFQGLDGPAQFALLLLMSGFFTVTLVLRNRRAST